DDLGYNASVELLDAMLTPYYSYIAIRSDVLSGVFPGTPLDSTTRTVGLRYHRDELRALGEYQRMDWDISPYRSWRTEVQYSGSLSTTSRAYAIASYLNKYFPQGTSPSQPEAITDRIASASGNYQKQFPDQNLILSAGGSVSRLSGHVDGHAYSLNSSLTWKVGKMDLTAGAAAYESETTGTTGQTDTTNGRSHQYYYFNLRRTF